MHTNSKSILLGLVASISMIAPPAEAKKPVVPSVQPYLCVSNSSSGSSSSFVNNGKGKLYLYLNLLSSNDSGGAVLANFTGIDATKSKFVLTTTFAPSSANLSISLAIGSNKGTFVVSPTAVSTKQTTRTYEFDFKQYNPPAGATVKDLAIIGTVSSGNTGNTFFTKYTMNGTEITKKVTRTGPCLQL